MSRIECETAAQCRELAARMEALMEPLILVTLVGVVAFAFAFNVYRMKKYD
jgi:hypothetical protein